MVRLLILLLLQHNKVVYPCGTVSLSSLGNFLSVGSSSKISHPSLHISLGAHNIQ